MYIIANFKQNLLLNEYKVYAKSFAEYLLKRPVSSKFKVVFCPPYPYLGLFQELNNFPNVSIGVQDVSQFNGGSYTGEVSAQQLANFGSYAIIGHSERRTFLNESIKTVNEKIKNTLQAGLTPIVCVSKLEEISELITLEGILLAYEPLENIGGKEAASNVKIQEFYRSTSLAAGIIYGGSVNSSSVKKLSSLNFVSGFLVGSASLSPKNFIEIIENLSQ